jgi:hypothetical protein
MYVVVVEGDVKTGYTESLKDDQRQVGDLASTVGFYFSYLVTFLTWLHLLDPSLCEQRSIHTNILGIKKRSYTTMK